MRPVTRPRPSSARLLLAALLAGAGAARVAAADPVPEPMALAAPHSAVLQPVPGVEVQYELLAPGSTTTPGPARVQGALDTGEGRLRSSVRIDPGAERHVGTVDTQWELPGRGPLRNLVLGDTYATGAGWSDPARLTGLRFGRAQALRAPLRVGDAPALPSLGFAGAGQGVNEAGQAPFDARRWLPAPAAPATAAAPVPGDATPLEAGKTDYEVELGRLRNGWDTPDRTYLSHYAAAAYRAGLGLGITAEARSEWTGLRSAHGLEVLKDIGAGARLQAVVAQSAAGAADGLRWGMGVVRNTDGLAWRLAFDTAERGYTTLTGGTEARSGLRAGATLPLGPRTSADVTLLRKMAWDAAEPETALDFATHVGLVRRMKLSFDVGLREGPQPGWRAGLSLSVPLDPRQAR